MLTATSGAEQTAAGLELGADDYLAKPFEFVELVARVRALARRPSQTRAPVLEAGGIAVDSAARTATRDGRLVVLARKGRTFSCRVAMRRMAITSSSFCRLSSAICSISRKLKEGSRLWVVDSFI